MKAFSPSTILPNLVHPTLKSTLSLAVFGAALVAAGMAFADPKPRNSKAADGQTIANMYVGKTQVWKTCRGGVYFGAGGNSEGLCHKEGGKPSIGLGTWSVTRKGKICADMRWHWGAGADDSKPNKRPDCIQHVVDADGQIWRRFNDDKDWWRFNADSVEKGNTLKRKTNRLKRKYKI